MPSSLYTAAQQQNDEHVQELGEDDPLLGAAGGYTCCVYINGAGPYCSSDQDC